MKRFRKFVYVNNIKMLYYDIIDISEGIDTLYYI